MIHYYKLKELIGLTVSKACFIMYPPLYEDGLDKVDISINLTFDTGDSITFTTHENLWTEIIKYETFYRRKTFSSFYERIDFWMNSEDADREYLEYEVFDLVGSTEFDFLFSESIKSIKLLDVSIGDELNPYGILLEFSSGNYLCSRSGFDGNMIQTKTFLPTPNPLECFSFISTLRIVDVQYLMKDNQLPTGASLPKD